jgi:NADH-quinone oxidoreductase subunit N
MNWNQIALMQNEIVLTIVILLVLISDLIVKKNKKKTLSWIAIILFGIQTIIGFLQIPEGELFGGMFKTTPLISGFKSILNIGVFLIVLQSASWLHSKLEDVSKLGEYYAVLFSSVLGIYFMLSAGHFLVLYIGLELSILPISALAAYEIYNRRSSEAAIKLILSAAVSSAVFLFGISIMYAVGGSLYFNDITNKFTVSYLSVMGLVFLFAGLGFKISLVPFHFWTADVYEGAPTPISNYLSVISKAGAVFILMILLFIIFRTLESIWIYLVYGITVLTMFIGNFFALRQKNLKRFLAFSSIAQAGFILMAMVSVDQYGVASIVYFMAIYVFSNIGAFGVVEAVSMHTGKENIDDYNGLYRTNPLISLVMMLALFSLAGIPPLAGFFGKFFLYTAAASKGFYVLVFIAVVNVTISLYYYLLVIRSSFLRKSDNPIPYFKSDNFIRVSLFIVAITLLGLGLYSPFYDYIHSISDIINF